MESNYMMNCIARIGMVARNARMSDKGGKGHGM